MSEREPWYEKWQDEYLGHFAERRALMGWIRENADLADDEDALLEQYRETQEWTDAFLDWAWRRETRLKSKETTK